MKIITGFREDQYKIIPDEEVHKAYYLFSHPDERGIFSNGVVMIGADIRDIQPDYNEEMGWNSSHKIDDFDWNEIKKRGVDRKLREVLQEGKTVAHMIETKPELLSLPLSKILENQKQLHE